jgi:hypothetical protein
MSCRGGQCTCAFYMLLFCVLCRYLALGNSGPEDNYFTQGTAFYSEHGMTFDIPSLSTESGGLFNSDKLAHSSPPRVRKEFPETWLWSNASLG